MPRVMARQRPPKPRLTLRLPMLRSPLLEPRPLLRLLLRPPLPLPLPPLVPKLLPHLPQVVAQEQSEITEMISLESIS